MEILKVKKILDNVAGAGTEHLNKCESRLCFWDVCRNYFRFCYLTGHQSRDTWWDRSSRALRPPPLVHGSRIPDDSKGPRTGLHDPHKADQDVAQGTSAGVTCQSPCTIVFCTEVCWCEPRIWSALTRIAKCRLTHYGHLVTALLFQQSCSLSKGLQSHPSVCYPLEWAWQPCQRLKLMGRMLAFSAWSEYNFKKWHPQRNRDSFG